MTFNLHTHSFYCGHGSGTIAEYAAEAERCGFDALGFSEHCPFPDNRLSRSRMAYSSMRLYEEDVRNLICSFPILLGYEVDYFDSMAGYYNDLLSRVDYLICGTHYIFRSDGTVGSVFDPSLSDSDLRLYADSTIRAMSSGLFAFCAHPDVFLSERVFDNEAESVTKAILDAAEELRIPLELNGNGYMKGRGYPSHEFWERAADRDILVILSSDAHRVRDLAAPFDFLESFASEHSLKTLEIASVSPLSFRMAGRK